MKPRQVRLQLLGRGVSRFLGDNPTFHRQFISPKWCRKNRRCGPAARRMMRWYGSAISSVMQRRRWAATAVFGFTLENAVGLAISRFLGDNPTFHRQFISPKWCRKNRRCGPAARRMMRWNGSAISSVMQRRRWAATAVFGFTACRDGTEPSRGVQPVSPPGIETTPGEWEGSHDLQGIRRSSLAAALGNS
jgi:hypothetical protein